MLRYPLPWPQGDVRVTVLRVASRYAMEFPTENARREYLQEHPKANPAHHTVAKPQGDKPKEDPKSEHKEEKSEHKEEPKKSFKERLQALSEKGAALLKGAPASARKFIEDPSYRRKTLTDIHAAFVKAPEKMTKSIVHTVLHEIKEFKEAGEGVEAVMKGGKMTDPQKKAFRTVALHVGIAVAATLLTSPGGALAAAGAVGKSISKHVAMKAVSRALGHMHMLEELGHIGHGLAHVITKMGDDEKAEKKSEPEVALAQLVMAAVAKELALLDDDGIIEALEAGGD